MVGITESFVFSGTKGMSVKVTVTENYDNLANTSDISVAAEVVSSVYSGHIYYLDGAVAAAGQTLQTMSSFGGSHYVYVQQTNTPYPVAKGDDDHTGSPWSLSGIAHDTDGSKTITVSIQLTGEEANGIGADGWTVTGSREVTLTHIPRASTVAATNAAVGAVSMVAVSRKSTAYTHSVSYRFGSLTGYISPQGLSVSEVRFSDTSVAFPIPESFYGQIPNAKSGTCLLTCRTYDGANQIGEEKSSSFTVTTEETACKPQLSATVADSNSATLALTGDPNTLVRYMSAAKCTITAQAKNSAAIAAKTIAGNSVTGDTLVLPNVETGAVTFTATDSRGYRTQMTVQKKWIPYIHLTCHAEGKRTDPTSGNAKLVISGDYFADSFGASQNSLTLRYRINSGTWVQVTPTVKNNKYTAEISLTGLAYTNAYTLEAQATDKLQTVSSSVTVGKGIPVFDWGENDFSFHVPVHVKGGIYDVYGNSVSPFDYGLGTTSGKACYDCNAAITIGVYCMMGGSSRNTPSEYPYFGYGVLEVDARYGDVFQTIKSGEYTAVRQGIRDENDIASVESWTPWEYINPPMAAGVEYRTTERCEGKPVYAKRIIYTATASFGVTSGVANNTIAHEIYDFAALVRLSAKKGIYPFPMIAYSGGVASINEVNSTNIVVRTYNVSLTADTYCVDLYYTKLS